jgi:WD40 repeat protein
VRALCFDPRTGYIVSASYDRSVRVWEWREPRLVDSPPTPLSSSSSSTRSGKSSHELMYTGDTDVASVVGVADGVVGYRAMSGKRGTGRLVREFRDLHASHIFDVKFDVGRIVRWVDFLVSFL